MEETKNNLKSEVDESDSWTLVGNLVDYDDSDEGSINVELNEPSDSESLEVLEVEQAESEENSAQEDNESNGEKEDCCSNPTVNDCDDSCVSGNSVIHLASVQKVKKYVHHPSACINMWLSIVMVTAAAITLGLGIGHYLGSKRLVKARDTIILLKHENQVLEQELANAVVKEKFSENGLRYRDSIFGIVTRNDENVCYADKDYHTKINGLKKTMQILPYWHSYFSVHKQNPSFSNNRGAPNRPFLSMKFVKGDGSTNVNYVPKLPESSDERSQNSRDFVSKLNNQLTSLQSLDKKWGEFHENLALQSRTDKNCHVRLPESHDERSQKSQNFVSNLNNQLTSLQSFDNKWGEFCKNLELQSRTEKNSLVQLPILNQRNSSETISCIQTHVSETLGKNSSGNNNISSNNISVSSSNGYCRSKLNQCVLREENWKKNKESKCKALSDSQLFCSILFGNKKPLNKNRQRDRKEVRKLEVQKFALKNKKVSKTKERHLNNEGPSVDIKNSQLNEKKRELSCKIKLKKVNFQIRSQKGNKEQHFLGDQEKNYSKMHKHSTSNTKKFKKKIEGENFDQKEKKEKYENNKHKNVFKSEKGKEKEKKIHQLKKYFEKQKHKKFQHKNKELPKFFKKMSQRDDHINSKKFMKYNDKKVSGNGRKREYSQKHTSVKNWNKYCDRSSEKYYTGKANSKFCMIQMQLENPSIRLKFDKLKNLQYNNEKNNYNNKNLSENGNFKYGVDKYHKENNYQKDWKEKRKVHYTNVQTLEVYKS